MAAATGGPRFRDIVGRRELWGASLSHFCGNYTLYFLVGWVPYYLVRERHFSIADMAVFGGGVYLVQAVAAFAGGREMDW